MKRYKVYGPIIVTILILCVHPMNAISDDFTCYLEAGMDEVELSVDDIDSDGNPTDELWDGVLKKGDRQLIESSVGQIVYSYRFTNDGRTIGDNKASCKDGNIITVP